MDLIGFCLVSPVRVHLVPETHMISRGFEQILQDFTEAGLKLLHLSSAEPIYPVPTLVRHILHYVQIQFWSFDFVLATAFTRRVVCVCVFFFFFLIFCFERGKPSAPKRL